MIRKIRLSLGHGVAALLVACALSGSAFAKPSKPAKAAKPHSPFVGTWMVRRTDGKLDSSMKLVLNAQGSFRFVGSTYSSAGKYSADGSHLKLVWTEVDHAKVKPNSMHRDIAAAEDGTFTIDRFTYAKHP